MGQIEYKQFDTMGANLTQSDTRAITKDVWTKLASNEPFWTQKNDKIKGDKPEKAKKTTAYRSIVGQILCQGHPVSTTIGYHASHTATKCAELHLHHSGALNTTLKVIIICLATIIYLQGATQALRWKQCRTHPCEKNTKNRISEKGL